MIRALIVDDEPLARDTVRDLLRRDPDVADVIEARNSDEALMKIADANLVFLDVRMPGQNGFAVIENCPQPPPLIVMVSAHRDYALDAFDAQVVDYVLKPYDDARFMRALSRAKRRMQNEPDRLVIHDGSETTVVLSDTIQWLEAADYYVNLHTDQGCYLVRRSLQDLVESLGPPFIRVHRGAAVNLRRMRVLSPEGIELLDGSKIRVSRSRRAEVKRAVERMGR
ncbi:MAG: LytTR family DNA-binding domain-containing protein [Myxococcota bacterium]